MCKGVTRMETHAKSGKPFWLRVTVKADPIWFWSSTQSCLSLKSDVMRIRCRDGRFCQMGCESSTDVRVLGFCMLHLLRLFTGRNVEWNLLCWCSKTAGHSGTPNKNCSKSQHLCVCGIAAHRKPKRLMCSLPSFSKLRLNRCPDLLQAHFPDHCHGSEPCSEETFATMRSGPDELTPLSHGKWCTMQIEPTWSLSHKAEMISTARCPIGRCDWVIMHRSVVCSADRV